ncbi:hypothetical protein [Desulfatibacillum aliphaticivorans]|uniref:hypothetical protein n=1 Tax=Desulfatibacillum aliphaticivorans TaxID=218208 RepID=UPI0003FC007A|nr:hypothetical protein [Desulfatibacillum aliphaticivorans]
MDKQNQESSNQKKRDPDIAASEAALIRAGKLARKRARQAGVGVIIMKDGKIVEDFSEEKE